MFDLRYSFGLLGLLTFPSNQQVPMQLLLAQIAPVEVRLKPEHKRRCIKLRQVTVVLDNRRDYLVAHQKVLDSSHGDRELNKLPYEKWQHPDW